MPAGGSSSKRCDLSFAILAMAKSRLASGSHSGISDVDYKLRQDKQKKTIWQESSIIKNYGHSFGRLVFP
jgi:hypothetical protein